MINSQLQRSMIRHMEAFNRDQLQVLTDRHDQAQRGINSQLREAVERMESKLNALEKSPGSNSDKSHNESKEKLKKTEKVYKNSFQGRRETYECLSSDSDSDDSDRVYTSRRMSKKSGRDHRAAKKRVDDLMKG